MRQHVANRESEISDETFWSDSQKANMILSQLARDKKVLESYDVLVAQSGDLAAFFELLHENDSIVQDQEMVFEYEQLFNQFSASVDALELQSFLSDEYDHFNAVVSIHAGAGGTDAQDWAQMLYRMYDRWFVSKSFKVNIIDQMMGDEAGLKSITILVEGDFVYGLMKQEIGVHRLVRQSPFNANNKRQTSFASVDVIPQLSDDFSDLDIDPKELKIDTFRASGAGGQHVNKTDSAVRITHLPTGLVATSQASRSQLSNKETALSILKSRLRLLMKTNHLAKVQDIRGDITTISWGNQIRSYVLHPYKMVKDLRTKYETTDVSSVLNGGIDVFIQAKLRLKDNK